LPFADGTFDTVLGSLVLCSVNNPHRALREVKRVLRKPGGQLLLLEHTRPDSPLLARLTDVINGPWYTLNGRCNVNRRTGQMVAEAGFYLDSIESHLGGLLRLIIAHSG